MKNSPNGSSPASGPSHRLAEQSPSSTEPPAADRLRDALYRITMATANSTNSADLPQFISWVRAVADTALDEGGATPDVERPARTEAETADVWRPIETAPRERTGRFLIAHYPSPSAQMPTWVHDATWSHVVGVWGHWDAAKLTHRFLPTHWMPLPGAPK